MPLTPFYDEVIIEETYELSLKELGSLSSKYESKGNPGSISNNRGDKGGKSYGTYQLTTNSGHAQRFAESYGGSLSHHRAGTVSFDNAWKNEATINSDAFANAQHDYIMIHHYQPALQLFADATGIDVSNMPQVIHDMIWSIGVQHGSGGSSTIFIRSGANPNDSWYDILQKVYGERMKVNIYFSSSPNNIKQGVLKRFTNELNDALTKLEG